MTDTSSGRLPRTTLGGVLEVSAIGLGCMGMAEFYGETDEAESIRTIHGAVDLGMDFLDTAAMYGAGRSEEIVGKALAGGRRDKVVLATKCGLLRTPDGVRVDGRPEQIRRDIEDSLRRLRTDRIDLYYLHRIDPQVPVEESVGAMAEQVAAGKVRCLGLSEAGASTVKRGHAVHPITAVQSEYSLASRDPERAVLPTVRELGIGFVAYSPFSRGLLSGEVTSRADLTGDDMRAGLPRFSEETYRPTVRWWPDWRGWPRVRLHPAATRPGLAGGAGRGAHPGRQVPGAHGRQRRFGPYHPRRRGAGPRRGAAAPRRLRRGALPSAPARHGGRGLSPVTGPGARAPGAGDFFASSSRRFATPNLPSTLLTWFLTVCRAKYSSAAISSLE